MMEVNRTLRFGWKRPTKPHVSLRRSLKRLMDMYIQLFLHVRKAAKLQLSSLHVIVPDHPLQWVWHDYPPYLKEYFCMKITDRIVQKFLECASSCTRYYNPNFQYSSFLLYITICTSVQSKLLTCLPVTPVTGIKAKRSTHKAPGANP